MNLDIIINYIITTAAVVFLIVLAYRVNAEATFDSIAVLKTNGMTCSSCSRRVTTALKMQKGVAVTEVDVAGGWVIVGYDRKTVNIERLVQKITSIGFTTTLHHVLTPEQYKQTTGQYLGKRFGHDSGCCGQGGES